MSALKLIIFRPSPEHCASGRSTARDVVIYHSFGQEEPAARACATSRGGELIGCKLLILKLFV
jgi:hypothetical protein